MTNRILPCTEFKEPSIPTRDRRSIIERVLLLPAWLAKQEQVQQGDLTLLPGAG